MGYIYFYAIARIFSTGPRFHYDWNWDLTNTFIDHVDDHLKVEA